MSNHSFRSFLPTPGFGRALLALTLACAPLVALRAKDASAVAAASASTQRPPTAQAPLTVLDKYVHTPDPSYAWKAMGTVRGEGGTATFIDLTSQTWLTTNEVSQPTWRHWLVVMVPDDLQPGPALLFIAGGNNKDPKLPKVNGDLARIARSTKSVVAELRMVPNQPLVFDGDGVQRVEDDLIGYSWDKFLKTGDERWPARLPMTKAAVRGMDTITAYLASPEGGKRVVDTFVIAGGSKRGWTTWTTGIVDRRVVAICPIVIDVLNMSESMMHHYQAYGFFAPAVGEYELHHVMERMRTPEMHALQAIEDPFFYRDRLTMPKLLVNACGDQFFLPDSSQFYFDQLKGVKYLRYVPNADHSLRNSDAFDTLLAWQYATARQAKLPKFTWDHRAPNEVRVRAKDRPVEVKLWQATNPKARDFRLESIGPVWTSQVVAADRSGNYRAQVDAPAQGWTAYLLELTYDIGAPTKLKLTTDVRVIPDTLPYAPPEPKRVSSRP